MVKESWRWPPAFPMMATFSDHMLSATRSKKIETRKRVMLRSIVFTAAVVAIVAPVVLTTDAMAGSSTSTEPMKRHVRPSAHFVPQHRRRPVAHSVAPQVSAFRGQGYVYVPRKGIVDEACNQPTSACPNEMRNVQ
jgi:hypothetical protein